MSDYKATPPTSTTQRLRVYIGAPCASPVEVMDQTFTCDAAEDGAYYGEVFNFTNFSDAGTPTAAWLWRFAMDTDPTVFGLTA